MLLNLLLG
jgi:hypothetical protein